MMNEDKNHTISIDYLSILPKTISATISWKNLDYFGKHGLQRKEKQILYNLNGNVNPGKLSAIMGPSGAGKTTLLKILSGNLCQGIKGEISVNGQIRNLEHFKKMSCFISDSDYQIENLTVEETMNIAVNLKVSKDVSREDKQKIISEILLALQLAEDKKKIIRVLSRGEKKRVVLASELVSNPAFIFMDEPTSGLDSFNAYKLICFMKTLASTSKRTIIHSIHQPSSSLFLLFDELVMLVKGQCLYHGPVKTLVSSLNEYGFKCPVYYNPADFITEIAFGEHGSIEKLIQRYKETSEISDITFVKEKVQVNRIVKASDFTSLVVNKYPTSNFNQLLVMTKRSYIAEFRHIKFLSFRLFSVVIAGILAGLIFRDYGNNAHFIFKNAAVLLYNIVLVSLTGLLPIIFKVPDEINVFRRENANGWCSVKMYYLAKLFTEVPLQILAPVIYSSIFYWMTQQPPEMWRFLCFTLFLILTALCSYSICLISAVSLQMKTVVFLAPMMMIPFMIFTGTFATYEALPSYLHWMFTVSYMKHSTEGVVLSVYGYQRTPFRCPNAPDEICLITDPRIVLKELDVLNDDMNFNIVALSVMILVYQFMAFCAMQWRMRNV